MRALLFIVALGLCAAADGQIVQRSAELLSNGRILIGVDPENPIDQLNALRDSQVLNGLQVSADAGETLQQHLKDYDRAFQEFLRKNRRTLTQEQFKELTGTLKDEASAVVDEVLTPEQAERLPQILYRIEVSVLGWAESLTNGRLGEAVAVYDGQKERIARKTAEILEERNRRIAEAHKTAEEEILGLLSPEQRKAAEEKLGEFLLYEQISRLKQMSQRLLQKRNVDILQGEGSQ